MKPRTKKTTPTAFRTKPQTARIRYLNSFAQRVSIAGPFNGWRPDATPMIRLGEGWWAKELMLPPGQHEYRLVVDGQWICDPAAVDQVPNQHGSHNSVLIVGVPA